MNIEKLTTMEKTIMRKEKKRERDKMKRVILGALFIGLLTPISAYADEDSPGTYAVLNSNNEVTNIIVCQPSVCGGGKLGGDNVVLQVPNNPSGSQYGYYNPSNPVTYEPNTQTFNVPSGGVVNSQVIDSGSNITDQLTASVSGTIQSFKAPKKVTDTLPVLSAPTAISGATATLEVVEINGNACVVVSGKNVCETKSQSTSFTTPQTAQQILANVIKDKLDLIQKNINSLFNLLAEGAIK
jgi:hypothetical protein